MEPEPEAFRWFLELEGRWSRKRSAMIRASCPYRAIATKARRVKSPGLPQGIVALRVDLTRLESGSGERLDLNRDATGCELPQVL